MARLIAKSPLETGLPVAVGGCRLEEVVIDRATAVMPFAGAEAEVAGVLRDALGLTFPEPGRSAASDASRVLWAGRGQALLIGAAPPEALGAHAALADQSDAWAGFRLAGPSSAAVLARLVPIDLRAEVFGEGQVARTLLFHMACTLTRVGPEAFEIFVMRSMARTALHDLTGAMRTVAARG